MPAFIQFVLAHQVVFAALGVAVLDLVFAINPKAESNGVLHWVFVALKGKAGPAA